MSLETTGRIEGMESVDDGDNNNVIPANGAARQAIGTGVAVDSTGEIGTLDTAGKDTLDVAVDADDGSSAQYGIEAGPDGETWFGPFVTSGTGIDEWLETLSVGARFVRLTVVSAASDETTADVFLGAS
jgi:hypothetical protein